VKVEVKNRRTYDGPGEYVGRPSLLGNPYRIGIDGDREEVIRKYDRWLTDEISPEGRKRCRLVYDAVLRLVQLLRTTGHLVLICWCAPLPCHADVIARKVRELAQYETEGKEPI